MASIGSRHRRVKQELKRLLPPGQIERIAKESGHRWRDRKLSPVMTLYLWIMQVLLCNLSSVHSRHLSSKPLSVSAVCQAKMRLPLQLLRRLSAYLVAQVQESNSSRWHGHRVFAGDGVTYYTPDTPQLRKRLGSKKPFGYPLLKSLSLFNLCNGVMTHQIPLPHKRQEAPLVGRILRRLLKGDLLLLDRAFASFWNMLQAQQSGIHLLVRLKKCFWAKAGTRRTVIKRLGSRDSLVRWERPKERSMMSLWRWMSLPHELTLRQVSLCVRRKGYRPRHITLITTLLDPKQYPASEIAALYHRRWEIETCFRHLKQTLNLEHLRCKTLPGVRKELLIRMMAYNLVRATMQRVAELAGTDAARVSFADTLQWLILSATSSEDTITINALRPGRIEPRRLKRQKKNYLPLDCSRLQARKKAA
jgi:hypothetical protein